MKSLFELKQGDLFELASLAALGVLFGLVIAYIYKTTHKGISYSQSFVQMLVALLPLGAVVFFYVSNNLATAIGLFGAFSLIRFRTAVKEVKDLVFLFWALATSLILAMGGFWPAMVVTVVVGVVLYFLSTSDFGKIHSYEQVITYQLDTKKSDHSLVSQSLKELVTNQELINVRNLDNGTLLEISLGLTPKKNVAPDQILKKLLEQKGVKTGQILSTRQHTEF